MSAEYLVSSLPPLQFDGPAPMSADAFAVRCDEWLSARDAAAVRAILAGADSPHPAARRWKDLKTQMKNAVSAERARKRRVDAAKWKRDESGCDLFWKSRVSAAFRETDPLKREALIDRAEWDAAAELTPPANPLGAGAAFTYAARLPVAARRSALDAAAGNGIFEDIVSAACAAAGGKDADR